MKIKAIIKNKLPGIADVKLSYEYEDIMLSREDCVRLAIPHIIEEINGSYAAVTKTIRTDEYILRGDVLSIMALGEKAVDKLNCDVAPIFERLFKEHFALELSVAFKNLDDAYIKAQEEKGK